MATRISCSWPILLIEARSVFSTIYSRSSPARALKLTNSVEMQDSQIDPDSTEEQQIQSVISEAKKYYANNDREKAINLFEVAIDMMEQSDKIDPTLLLETLKVTVDAV